MILAFYYQAITSCEFFSTHWSFLQNAWFGAEFDEADVNPRRFDYNELRIATKNFDEDMKLGAGAYGAVYKVLIPSLIHPEQI